MKRLLSATVALVVFGLAGCWHAPTGENWNLPVPVTGPVHQTERNSRHLLHPDGPVLPPTFVQRW